MDTAEDRREGLLVGIMIQADHGGRVTYSSSLVCRRYEPTAKPLMSRVIFGPLSHLKVKIKLDSYDSQW